jgi:starch phosphorylase
LENFINTIAVDTEESAAVAQENCLPLALGELDNSPEAIKQRFLHYLGYHFGRLQGATPQYVYTALSLALRDQVMVDWRKTAAAQNQPGCRRAFYLSLEFLVGRSLGNHVLNLGLQGNTAAALQQYCMLLEDIESLEPDAGLGNGGLGRLAACFMDSCATLQLPVMGYGLRYEYGMFRQLIVDGYQQEEPDQWLRDSNPWELKRPEFAQRIQFGGHTERYEDENGRLRWRWVDTDDVIAMPYDMPVSGYRNQTVNTLRLWKSTATEEFNLAEFNDGSYTEAVSARNGAEDITMVLYPNDATENGKELRLRQQYFLASASLKDVMRQWGVNEGEGYQNFARQNVFQMNDTHPTIAVPELMRLLMDDNGMNWEEAWTITSATTAYTNHTLLPEALERWPVSLFRKLLPRLLGIIYEINKRFLHTVEKQHPGDADLLQRVSIIDQHDHIRMAYLALVASYSVNGVAALHSKLLSEGLFRDFYALWPHKFNNKTNGVTPRRWLAHANPGLSGLIAQQIGNGWLTNLGRLAGLAPLAGADQSDFQTQWKAVKLANKQRLIRLVERQCDVTFDVDALFDVQVKRIHEYKRQLLNALHIIHLYLQIKAVKADQQVARCVLIGGKAAPGYEMAKHIIKLINNIADVVNNDPDVGGQLKVAFFPNYNVSAMEVIAPGTDLSEQISTAGKEASGTGNMKFMMNGALTIGTYDGANIEILEAVGEDDFVLFGLHAEEVEARRADYDPVAIVASDPALAGVVDSLKHGLFNQQEPGIFDSIIEAMLSPEDPWMTIADFRSYIDAQARVEELWRDQAAWVQMSIRNVAASGFFSTDRTMQEYNEDIWKLTPVVP